ncbi:MAG TPA: peptidase S8 [Nocardioides bacterium]|uniref:S8 family peptidase n=1 Tax=uncultured Nocardioides sp. TaxID=198441 RepID=UPI000EDB36E0|nr:S8 family serine peptidase [uncultured Nocardioides sp.]HCB07666.1 peptidase S8 [Nocardioides sp.]
MKHHLVVKMRRRLPEPPRIPDWITFITDKSSVVTSVDAQVDAVLRAAGRLFWVTHEYAPALDGWAALEVHHGLDRTYRLVLQQGEDRLPDEVLLKLAAQPSVESAHQLEVGGADLPDNLPVAVATARGVDDGGRGLIGLDFARALSRGRRDVRVAVLDTGINLDHPELRGKIVAKADFVDLQGLDTSSFVGDFLGADDDPEDELGHGTHVAGIIAAEGVGMDPGIAPGCSLMAVRVLATLRSGGRDQGAGVVDNINPGIKFAADNDADVINMSLGIRHVGGGLPHEDVIRYALARGVTVVAASGNDGTDTKYYPGALPGVVAVGAVDGEGRVASFTSYGAQITVVAPGVNILSSFAHGRYAVASGTSQASPCVAGAVALLKSFARDNGVRLGPDDVLRILRETSDRPDRRLRSTHAGYGVLNMTDAFKWLMASLN